MNIAAFDRHRDAVFVRKRRRLRLCGRREIERHNVEPLLGQPDAVAAFAVGDGERPARFRQQMSARGEEIIRLPPERITRRVVARFLAVVFAHKSPYRAGF